MDDIWVSCEAAADVLAPVRSQRLGNTLCLIFEIFPCNLDTSRPNGDTRERKLQSKKKRNCWGTVLQSTNQWLEKPHFSLFPYHQGSCLRAVRTVGYRCRSSGWLQNHFRSSCQANSWAGDLASSCSVRCPLLWVRAINPVCIFQFYLLDLLLL